MNYLVNFFRLIVGGHHDETSSVPERNVNIFQVTRDQDCRVYVLVQPINRRGTYKIYRIFLLL